MIMASTLDIVNNQLLQEGISSNPFLRRQAIRKAAEDTTFDEAPEEATQPAQTYNTNTNYTGGNSTLASTYSKLLDNYTTLGGSLGNSSSSTTQSNNYNSSSKTKTNIPNWAPTAVSIGAGLAGLPKVGAIGSAALSLARGDTAGGVGKLASLFTNNITKGKVPGLGSLVGTLANSLINGDDLETTGKNLFNSGLGTVLYATNPVLGLGYGVGRLFGLNVANGLSGLFDTRSVPYESWKGSFFGGSGYKPEEGSYMSSGNNNYSPYGGAPLNSPTESYGTLNTGAGSGFNSANWGSGLSGTTADDSGSDY